MRKLTLPFLIFLIASAALAQPTERQRDEMRNAGWIATEYTPRILAEIAAAAHQQPSGSPAEQFAQARQYWEGVAQLQAWLYSPYRNSVLAGGANEQTLRANSTDATTRFIGAAIAILKGGGSDLDIAGQNIKYVPVSAAGYSPRAAVAAYALIAIDFSGVGTDAQRAELMQLGKLVSDPTFVLTGYREMAPPSP
jgi:hypothetical protein